MIVRFSVENFKSFCDKQELTMIPAKKIKKNKEHVVSFDKVSLLRTATIYGANASGKSNLIEAMKFAKYVITNRVPLQANKMYCRVVSDGLNRDSTFEFEIFKNNKFYAYGFSMNLFDRIIKSEWLYELVPGKDLQHMLFERETEIKRIELGDRIKLDEMDRMKFKTYTLDFEDNNSGLFLKEMNRNKKIKNGSSLEFFKDVFEWFEEDLVTIFPDQPITDFEYFYGDDGNQKINQIIDLFDTGISKVKIEEISLSDLKSKLPSKLLEEVLTSFKNKLENSDHNKNAMMSLRTRNAFYNIKGVPGEEPIITTIMLEHGAQSFSDFEFDEESDGTRRLFDLLDILISNKKNKVYVIDELERSLHPKLTYKFIELFFEILKNNHTQLIFTTHESTIMDQNLLRRDEIWFVERNKDNISHLYSLDRFKERYDKKLSKNYLDGRYGGIPILKIFPFSEDGEV
ncbi:ATP/GTP-binding protein [Paenibacillus sp. NPDC056933]|uniref:AAA family ATPase n=1 Tax=Paenibacillus sp. NPDC056933 TaxID=3345968 RepID=UPI00362F4410